jgi:hypothetical protein
LEGEGQKVIRHLGANRMDPDIVGAGVTTSVAVKAGDRIVGAILEIGAEHVLRHRGSFLRKSGVVNVTGLTQE